jgi:hypothetical protein
VAVTVVVPQGARWVIERHAESAEVLARSTHYRRLAEIVREGRDRPLRWRPGGLSRRRSGR